MTGRAMLRRIHTTLWRIRVGRCGPLARRLALLARRLLPVRGIGPLTSIVLGAPPGSRPCPVTATVDGAEFELDLRESLHRVVYLDLFSIELRRVVLPVLRPGDTVVDAGANFGFWTVLAARRGANVLAIEPIAATRALLATNVARNGVGDRVEIVAGALSDQIGAITIALPDGESGHASAYPDPGAAVETFTVDATTIDELLADRPVRLLKIDVEGHEAAVLRGGHRVLSNGQVDYLLLELTNSLLARTGTSAGEIIDLLTRSGYRFVRFVRANEGLAPRGSYTPVTLADLRTGAHAGDALWMRTELEQTPTPR